MLADTLSFAPASVSELHPKVQPVLLQYPVGPPSLASNLLAPLLQLADTADNDAIRAGVIAVCWDAGVLFTFAQTLARLWLWLWLAGTPATALEGRRRSSICCLKVTPNVVVHPKNLY